MKFALVALGIAAVANAQQTALIPTNITSTCNVFLTTLNTDDTLATCVTPLLNATGSFSPTSGTNLTEDTINFTLTNLCKSSAGCSDSTIRTWLSNFYSACTAELTSSTAYNAEVRELYDILYVVNPLKAAVCSIDSKNQDYCVNEIRAAELNGTTTSTNASNNTLITSFAVTDASPIAFAAANLYITIASSASSLSKRVLSVLGPRQTAIELSNAAIITPNTTTYRATNPPFLFLQPSMDASALCTPCTREVLVAYVKWESAVPYALGLNASPILGGQRALWSAIGETCGQTFISAITSEAGVYAAGSALSGGDKAAVGGYAVGAIALVAGIMTVFA